MIELLYNKQKELEKKNTYVSWFLSGIIDGIVMGSLIGTAVLAIVNLIASVTKK